MRALLFFLCVPLWATIAPVQTCKQNIIGGSGSTISVAFGSNVTSGNLITVWAWWAGNVGQTSTPTTTITGVSDTLSNSYTSTVSSTGSPQIFWSQKFYAYSPSGGANTVTISWSGLSTATWYPTIYICEWPVGSGGLATSSPLDQTGASYTSTSGNASATTSGATAVSGELLLACAEASPMSGPGTGYTSLGIFNTQMMCEYKIGSAAQSETATFNNGGSSINKVALIDTFKPYVAPATPVPRTHTGLMSQLLSRWIALDMLSFGSTNSCFDPSAYSISGGSISLTLSVNSRTCSFYNINGSAQIGPTTEPHTGAMLFTRFLGHTYGQINFRLQAPNSTVAWPAVWLVGTNCQQLFQFTLANSGNATCPAYPDTSYRELDIFETQGSPGASQMSLFGGGSFTSCNVPSFDVTQYHVFNLTWASGSLVLTVDGGAGCTITQAYVPSANMFILIDNTGVNSIGSTVPVTPQNLLIDYIHWCPAGVDCTQAVNATIFDEEFNAGLR